MKEEFKEHLNELGYREAVPKPTQAQLNQHYREKYYQNPQGSYAADYTPDEIRYFRNIATVAQATMSPWGIDRSLLDLGCGEGFFAKRFLDSGYSVTCCDYSEFGVAKHNEQLLPFFNGGDIYESIDSYLAQEKTFGCVNLQNVLEHVLDPIALLVKLKKLLRPGHSVLRVKVPNDYSEFQLALLEKGLTTATWFAPPEHLSYFDTASLGRVLQHCGYEIRSMQADFPIELFLVNPHSNYAKDRKLGKGAHMTRIFCENFLIGKDTDAYLRYSEAAAELGFGRDLTVYASVSNDR
jgi:2-polyprenyl-3-methyl-5-hydroxy-6-metoxy-1,4-benzoquinol methylase